MRAKPIRPIRLNAQQRARAILFHSKKLTEQLDLYSDTVFKAWVLINSSIDMKRILRVHLEELCRITKGTKPKCR